MNKTKKTNKIKKTKNIKGDGLYDKAVNLLFKPDVPLRDGEKHAILWDKNKKKWTSGAFMGPGTDILGRIKQGVKPVSDADLISKIHDINYSLANNIQAVKEADNKMIERLKKARETGKDTKYNTYVGQIGIEANRLLGKVLPDSLYDKWVNYMTGYKEFRQNLKPEDRLLLQEELKKSEKELGYGKKKRKYQKRSIK